MNDTTGDFSIDGVSGCSSIITLDFLHPGGSRNGKILPTGHVTEPVDGVEVSCVDAGNPVVFTQTKSLGIDEPLLPDATLERPQLLQRIERNWQEAALRMGLVKLRKQVPLTIPKVGPVRTPTSGKLLSGLQHPADIDIVTRVMSDKQPHRASPLTAIICTAAAATLEGSIVERCLRKSTISSDYITIGHASGNPQAMASLDSTGQVDSVAVLRTARKLMEGQVFYPGT